MASAARYSRLAKAEEQNLSKLKCARQNVEDHTMDQPLASIYLAKAKGRGIMSLIRKTWTTGTCQGFPLRCLLMNHSILVQVVSPSSYNRGMHIKPVLAKAKATYPLEQEATIFTHTPHIKISNVTRTSNDIFKEHLNRQDPAFFIFLHSKEHVGSRMIVPRRGKSTYVQIT
jgi:hypothetical protein